MFVILTGRIRFVLSRLTMFSSLSFKATVNLLSELIQRLCVQTKDTFEEKREAASLLSKNGCVVHNLAGVQESFANIM